MADADLLRLLSNATLNISAVNIERRAITV